MAKAKKPAKKAAKKAAKKPTAKYSPPLLVKGQFGEVVKVVVPKPAKSKEKAVKKKK